jgi:hypothetical protein
MTSNQHRSSRNAPALRGHAPKHWQSLAFLLAVVAFSACTSTTSEKGNGPTSGASRADEVDQQQDSTNPRTTGGSSAPEVDGSTESQDPVVGADAGRDSGIDPIEQPITDPIEPPITEPITEENYYVRNLRSDVLRVVATGHLGDTVELLEDTVAPQAEVHIFHASEGSGGHALPTNFFATFEILVGDEVVYEGVRDNDWQDQDHGLVLVISADDARQSLDFACEQAVDCEIKDVRNCCGYYPRCVNVNSPVPVRPCDDGVVGVCGWPHITHCECVENTCRSMQGDNEI